MSANVRWVRETLKRPRAVRPRPATRPPCRVYEGLKVAPPTRTFSRRERLGPRLGRARGTRAWRATRYSRPDRTGVRLHGRLPGPMSVVDDESATPAES